MPNTKSAERRARGSARKHQHNQAIKSNVKSLERNFKSTLEQGKKEEAAKTFRDVVSALDKAAKTGVLHKGTVDRKKSRLAVRLAALKA